MSRELKRKVRFCGESIAVMTPGQIAQPRYIREGGYLEFTTIVLVNLG